MAAKIIDGMEKLFLKYESSAKRWIWELIQNAKDASCGSKPVKIEIDVSKEFIEFKHSGKPFSL